MKGKMLYLMIIRHFLKFDLIAGLHVAEHLEVAVPDAILENGSKDHIAFIEGEIDDERMRRLSRELEVVQHLELLVEYLQRVRPGLQHVVLALLGDVG